MAATLRGWRCGSSRYEHIPLLIEIGDNGESFFCNTNLPAIIPTEIPLSVRWFARAMTFSTAVRPVTAFSLYYTCSYFKRRFRNQSKKSNIVCPFPCTPKNSAIYSNLKPEFAHLLSIHEKQIVFEENPTISPTHWKRHPKFLTSVSGMTAIRFGQNAMRFTTFTDAFSRGMIVLLLLSMVAFTRGLPSGFIAEGEHDFSLPPCFV